MQKYWFQLVIIAQYIQIKFTVWETCTLMILAKFEALINFISESIFISES